MGFIRKKNYSKNTSFKMSFQEEKKQFFSNFGLLNYVQYIKLIYCAPISVNNWAKRWQDSAQIEYFQNNQNPSVGVFVEEFTIKKCLQNAKLIFVCKWTKFEKKSLSLSPLKKIGYKQPRTKKQLRNSSFLCGI